MSWENRNFKELGFLGRGKSRHRPRNDESLYGGDYPMIQTGDVKAANFYLNSFSQTYNDKGLAQSKLWNPNTLCITIAANIAETAILGMKACFPDSIIGFIADEEKSDVRFIKYFFDIYKERMQRISQGATQDNLSLEKLLTFEVPTPPLQTQKRIADILSAYDNLIENNLKRINLLEQAAQNIYKEWFVNLRFPGHENTPINEETGLPEGWKEVLAKEYFDFKRGIEVGSKNYVSEESDNTIPFLRVGSLGSRDTDVFTDISLVKDRILNFEDVCISMDGSIGLVGYGLIGAYSTGLRKIAAKSNKYSTGFIYGLLKSEEIQDTIRAYAKGSTILHASSSIEHLKFNDANEEISTQFNKVIDPIYSKLLNLNKQNQKLKAARDILLPRLMNRTIEV